MEMADKGQYVNIKIGGGPSDFYALFFSLVFNQLESDVDVIRRVFDKNAISYNLSAASMSPSVSVRVHSRSDVG